MSELTSADLYPARFEYDDDEGYGIIWGGPGGMYAFHVECNGNPNDEWALAIVEAINRAHVADAALALVREAFVRTRDEESEDWWCGWHRRARALLGEVDNART